MWNLFFKNNNLSYINESGFTCCNRELEASMKSAMSGNDLLGTADSVQSGYVESGNFKTNLLLFEELKINSVASSR